MREPVEGKAKSGRERVKLTELIEEEELPEDS